MLCIILEIVHVYNWSPSMTPHKEAELKFPGTLDISILEANKSVMRFALHGISAWWWTFPESTYGYDNVPAQEICYTVACEKGRAVLAHHCCGSAVHNSVVSFPKGEEQYLFLQIMSVQACTVESHWADEIVHMITWQPVIPLFWQKYVLLYLINISAPHASNKHSGKSTEI